MPPEVRLLLRFVERYFSVGAVHIHTPAAGAGAGTHVRQGNRPPLYLQYTGHAMVVVGIIEERRQDTRSGEERESHLLVFNPAKDGRKISASLLARRGWQRAMKCGTKSLLKKGQFQLVCVEPRASTSPSGSPRCPSRSSGQSLTSVLLMDEGERQCSALMEYKPLHEIHPPLNFMGPCDPRNPLM